MGTNCALVVLYAEAIRNYLPLMATSVFGVFMAVVYSIIYHHYTPNCPAVYKLETVCIAITIVPGVFTALELTGVTQNSHSQVVHSLGWITIFSNSSMHISPIPTIKRVIKTKNAASIQFSFCLLNSIHAALWLVYSALVSEWLLFVPNALGFPLGIVQVTSWLIYRPVSLGGDKTLAVLPTSAVGRESIVSEIVSTPRDVPKRTPSAELISNSFTELVKPRQIVYATFPIVSVKPVA